MSVPPPDERKEQTSQSFHMAELFPWSPFVHQGPLARVLIMTGI